MTTSVTANRLGLQQLKLTAQGPRALQDILGVVFPDGLIGGYIYKRWVNGTVEIKKVASTEKVRADEGWITDDGDSLFFPAQLAAAVTKTLAKEGEEPAMVTWVGELRWVDDTALLDIKRA